jgi:hypothetical protein
MGLTKLRMGKKKSLGLMFAFTYPSLKGWGNGRNKGSTEQFQCIDMGKIFSGFLGLTINIFLISHNT